MDAASCARKTASMPISTTRWSAATLELLYVYGVGEQIHVEDLADYQAGRGRRDARELVGRA